MKRLLGREIVNPTLVDPENHRNLCCGSDSTVISACCRGLCLALMAVLVCIDCRADEPRWESLIPGTNVAEHAVKGTWKKSGMELSVAAEEGARLTLPVTAPGEYDLRASFTRRSGVHSVGLVCVVNGHQVVFEVDAWGQHLAGFQNVGGRTIRENVTRRENYELKNGRRYTITVQVRSDSIRGLLDDKEVCRYTTDGSDLSMHEVWSLPESDQLGLVSWEGDTVFHSVEIRGLGSDPVKMAKVVKPESSADSKTGRPAPRTGKRNVLIVIANEDFFYREYAEPREELERAGIRVTVAAGRKATCRPHQGSGEGPDGGAVQPDLALKDVKADDFDSVLFSGGWGASSYQFAFPGRYDKASYNGNRSIRTEANRIINEFIQQDKYVCALCNGVSVVAWARVNGHSPLEGKRVCAPVREAASGIYNGQRAQPSCRWHPQANGAILSPSGSIGQQGTVADDVLVDGKIITGEDDPSAREMGRVIVKVLSAL